MRSAPPADPPAGEPDEATLAGRSEGTAQAGIPSHPDRSLRLRNWVVGCLVLLALAGGVTAFLLTRHHPVAHPGAHGSPSPSPSPIPPAEAFAFTTTTTDVVGVTSAGKPAAEALAATIRTSLTSFYQQAFATPSTWTKGVPASAWDVFASPVRPQAERDASSLALGRQAPGLVRLHVGEATLTVHVLVDGTGHPVSAFADVSVQATGSLKDGTTVEVTNTATLLFRRLDQAWVITGYPVAKTTVTSTLPAPGPSASTGGASPLPSGSPSS